MLLRRGKEVVEVGGREGGGGGKLGRGRKAALLLRRAEVVIGWEEEGIRGNRSGGGLLCWCGWWRKGVGK